MRSLPFITMLLVGMFTFGQHQEKVDFIHADIIVVPYAAKNLIQGTVTYEFRVLADVDSIFLDAHQMAFKKVLLNSKKADFRNAKDKLIVVYRFRAGRKYRVQFEYSCMPKQALYYIGFDDAVEGNEQIWTQGQGKYTSNWLPSFDDMTEKVEFDLSVIYEEDFTVIANGTLLGSKTINGKTQWNFDMQNPMSSYLLAFAIGKYDQQQLMSETGIPIENYYYPTDSLKVEPTYRYTKRIFDFLESEIGVPYPWQNYKQVPVHDFLYAGMENTSATFFSDGYVIDSTSFMDRNYVTINAHELAHQWFGNLVTEESGEHHWLQEGFATFYAYLAEKEVFGEDYFYWKLFDSVKELNNASEKGFGESLLNPKASSLTFYEKGALALVMLRDQLGEKDFKTGIKHYLTEYQFKNVTISDFLTEMEKVSGQNLDDFKDTWLNSTVFPKDEIKEFLMKHNHSISRFDVLKLDDPTHFFTKQFLEDSQLPTELKLALLKQQTEISPMEFLPLVTVENLSIRKFAAEKMGVMPVSLKEFSEPLLVDDNYTTNELMLYNLWRSFDYDRAVYLDKTKHIVGLPNRNVRLLWLTLALVTPDYNPSEKTTYFEELIGYTGPIYNPEVRQMAFQYLTEIQALNGIGIVNLIKATNHHSWQFRNFARDLLNSQLDDEEQKKEIVHMAKQLNSSDLRYLKTKIVLP